MIVIAHRGNRFGPDPIENTWKAVESCFANKLSVEVDVRFIDNQFYLGHDEPKELIDFHKLIDSRIWCHSKTPETFVELTKYKDVQTFYQDKDEISLTSNGYLWCHSSSPMISSHSIVSDKDYNYINCYGVYSDRSVAIYTNNLINASRIKPKPSIKLIILDIDGIMTDGHKTYDIYGDVISKTFYDKDFTAIKRFQSAGIRIVFLSSDVRINNQVSFRRQIPSYWVSPGTEKNTYLPMILNDYKLHYNEVAYVGDDYYDLQIIENLTNTYCPEDAVLDVQQRVKKVLPAKAGQGVIMALYEELKDQIPAVYPFDSIEVNS